MRKLSGHCAQRVLLYVSPSPDAAASMRGTGSDDAVVATEVHEGKEAQQTIVIGIEITILKGLVLGIPQGVDKLFLLLVLTHH